MAANLFVFLSLHRIMINYRHHRHHHSCHKSQTNFDW